MNNGHDTLSKEILKLIDESKEPFETKEIENELKKKTKDITRTRVFYRLMLLRGENLISGKFVGPGKGVWIWWKKEDKKC